MCERESERERESESESELSSFHQQTFLLCRFLTIFVFGVSKDTFCFGHAHKTCKNSQKSFIFFLISIFIQNSHFFGLSFVASNKKTWTLTVALTPCGQSWLSRRRSVPAVPSRPVNARPSVVDDDAEN